MAQKWKNIELLGFAHLLSIFLNYLGLWPLQSRWKIRLLWSKDKMSIDLVHILNRDTERNHWNEITETQNLIQSVFMVCIVTKIFFWKPLIFSFRNHIEQENCSLFVWILKKKHILQSNQINFAIEEVFQKSLLLSIRYEDDHSVFISWSWRKTTNKKLSTHNSYHFTHFLSILRDLRCVTH